MRGTENDKKRSGAHRSVGIEGDIAMKIAAIMFSFVAMTVAALAQATVSPKCGEGMHYDTIQHACVANSGQK
jgi:hypothetical protein